MTDQADQRDRQPGDDAGQCFGNQYRADDLPRRGAHCLQGFDQAAVDLAQCGFDQSGDERNRRDGQRYDGRRGADGGSDDQTGQGDDRDQQDDERCRTHGVGYHAKHAIQWAVLQQPVLIGDDQQDAQRQSEKGADGAGYTDHPERLKQRCLKQTEQFRAHRMISSSEISWLRMNVSASSMAWAVPLAATTSEPNGNPWISSI